MQGCCCFLNLRLCDTVDLHNRFNFLPNVCFMLVHSLRRSLDTRLVLAGIRLNWSEYPILFITNLPTFSDLKSQSATYKISPSGFVLKKCLLISDWLSWKRYPGDSHLVTNYSCVLLRGGLCDNF